MLSKNDHIANALFRSGSLKFGKFKLKSGVMSPYYIDLTWLLSSPQDFRYVINAIAEKIKDILSYKRVDKLASIELKGALLIPNIANKLKLPCIIVRKEKKRYGAIGRIAGGEVKNGDKVLFFDDVIASAKSKLEGIRPLEELGAEIVMVLVMVDREEGGKDALEKLGYSFHTLITISEIVNSLLRFKKITKKQANIVFNYIRRRI